jgi:BASS family bile acid:Na+ symporter
MLTVLRVGPAVVTLLVAGLWLFLASLAFRASPDDARALTRRPGRLIRALSAMLVVMPVVAVGIVSAFDLHRPVKIALVALALSPSPPLLPRRQLQAGGESSHVVALIIVAALTSIVSVPLTLSLLARFVDAPLAISPWRIARPVVLTVLFPLVIGMVVRRTAPAFAARAAAPMAGIALALLVAGLAPILAAEGTRIVSLVGNGTLAAMVVFCAAGLAVGHVMGGPERNGRVTLGLAAAARHPGVAITVATANYPHEPLVFSAILMYALVNLLVCVPYARWARNR